MLIWTKKIINIETDIRRRVPNGARLFWCKSIDTKMCDMISCKLRLVTGNFRKVKVIFVQCEKLAKITLIVSECICENKADKKNLWRNI